MERSDFQQLADACLDRFATWLEDFDADELDFALADGVLTFEFADGTRFVMNRQTAAGQMWLAAGAHAWHYDWDAEGRAWRCDRDGHVLDECVSRVVSEKLGRPVET